MDDLVTQPTLATLLQRLDNTLKRHNRYENALPTLPMRAVLDANGAKNASAQGQAGKVGALQ
jgi:hypothetical protein